MTEEKKGRIRKKSAALEITARADLSELRFTKVPEIQTGFEGNASWRSFSKSRRRNLPNEVRTDTDYRDAGIEWRSVSWIGDENDRTMEGGPEEPNSEHAED